MSDADKVTLIELARRNGRDNKLCASEWSEIAYSIQNNNFLRVGYLLCMIEKGWRKELKENDTTESFYEMTANAMGV